MITSKDTICFLGDSITDGIGTTKRYIEYIAEATGAKTYGFGVNGAKSSDLFAQLERLDETVGNNFDILFILIGTNDYNCGIPLGEFFTEHSERVPLDSDENGNFGNYVLRRKREFVFDENTFKGRLNNFFYAVKRKYFDKRVILATPLHRAYAYFGGDNIQQSELYANVIGEYFESYVDAVRKAADIWSVELIDLYRESGLFPLIDESAKKYYQSDVWDRLHPNANGHERIAQVILRRA